MKKKVLKMVALVVTVLSITKGVQAEERAYYTTANGIELTRSEYVFLTNFYWPGFPDVMTEDQYNEFLAMDLFNSELTVKTTEETSPFSTSDSPRSTSHTTPSKHITIGSACLPTKCIMNLVNTWTASPLVRSWDTIGAYLSGVSLISHNGTYVYSTNGSTYFTNLKTASNGIGNSVLLPTDGEDLIINMTFTVTKGGTVFGSYQHATQSTTFAVSQDYTFTINGYGNVFGFSETGYNTYDGMNGVDIDV